MGYLPNDKKAQKRVWKQGLHCNNGMNECMTKKQFSVWWADSYCKKLQEAFVKTKNVN